MKIYILKNLEVPYGILVLSQVPWIKQKGGIFVLQTS